MKDQEVINEILDQMDEFATLNEVTKVIGTVVKSIADSKKLTDKDLKTLERAIVNLDIEHRKILKELDLKLDSVVSDMSSQAKKELKKEIATLKTLLKQTNEAVIASKIDEQSIIDKAVSSVKIPDQITGEDIRNSLEALNGKDRLNASAIEGLEDLFKKTSDQKERVVMAANRYLYELLDVDVVGITNGQTIIWDSNLKTWKAGTISSADEKVKLDASDPTAGYLDAKLQQGIQAVQFDTTNTPLTNAEGLLQWNATDGTLDLGMSGGDVTQQIGQELFIKVYNDTGVIIPNGSPVYVSGRQGNRPKVALARSDSETTANVLGLATQDIPTTGDKTGFVTTFGLVRQIKTNYSGTGDWGTTWASGDNLYISKTIAGQLTNVEPTAPHHSDIIGQVATLGSAGTGSIEVYIKRHVTLSELSDINGTALTTTGQVPVWNNTAGYFDFDKNLNDYLTTTSAASTYLKLDQTTPQTVSNGLPIFSSGIKTTNIQNSGQTNKIDLYPLPIVPTYVQLVPTMTSATSPSGVVSSSGEYSGFEAWKAFNPAQSANGWISAVASPPQTLQYQFASSTVVNGYTITCPSITARCPTDWTFQGSNDGTNWTTLDTRSGVTGWSAGEVRGYTFTNSTAYTYYKIVVTANAGSTYVSIGQLVMANMNSYIAENAFITNGIERMRIMTNGNISLGLSNTAPTAKLHIAAGSATAGTAPLKLTSGTLLTTPENGALEYLSNNFYIRGNDGLLVNGKVGIGTTSPSSPLHVLGSGINSGGGIIIDTGITAKSSYQSLAVGTDLITVLGSNVYNDAGLGSVRYNTSKPAWYFLMDLRSDFDQFVLKRLSAAGALTIPFKVNSNGSVGIGGNMTDGSTLANAYLSVGSTGKVGIGNTNPSALLHIKAGTATANTAPLKLTSGTLLSTAEEGAIEFLTDDFYGTITTGAARKKFALQDTNVSFTNLISTGSQIVAYRAITALRTLDATDYFVDCTANTFTVTLPTAVGITGRTYVIKNSGTGVITTATTSSQTIDGSLTMTLSSQYASITVVSDGANWKII